MSKVLSDLKTFPEYSKVEALRRRLLRDKRVISIDEMGAGSSLGDFAERSVSSIARHAAKSPKFGQLLFRIVKEYQPQNIIELGTSLGITSSYLAMGNPGARMLTIEGSPEVAKIAEKNFEELGLKNIQLKMGNFDETLSEAIAELGSVDLAFIDGNHRQEPTERYFKEILNNINNDSILIFDDIHWSEGMEKAWDNIKNDPAVRCTVDLFFIGIVFFRQEFRENQHFVIRF